MVSNLLHELGPGSNLSSLRLFLSEREQSSHPLHLKSSSGEWEFVTVGLNAQCVPWVLPDIKLCRNPQASLGAALWG